jgi:hypothetical protein
VAWRARRCSSYLCAAKELGLAANGRRRPRTCRALASRPGAQKNPPIGGVTYAPALFTIQVMLIRLISHSFAARESWCVLCRCQPPVWRWQRRCGVTASSLADLEALGVGPASSAVPPSTQAPRVVGKNSGPPLQVRLCASCAATNSAVMRHGRAHA